MQNKSLLGVETVLERIRNEISAQDQHWCQLKDELRSFGDVQLAFESLPDFGATPNPPVPFAIRA